MTQDTIVGTTETGTPAPHGFDAIELSNDKPEAAHIVLSPDPKESHHAYVMRARIESFPVQALCGWTWVPKRAATGLPVCKECRDIWDSLPDDGGGWVRE